MEQKNSCKAASLNWQDVWIVKEEDTHSCAVLEMWKVFLPLALLIILLAFLNFQYFDLQNTIVEKFSFTNKIDLTYVKLEATYEKRRNLVKKICKSYSNLTNDETLHRHILYNSEHQVNSIGAYNLVRLSQKYGLATWARSFFPPPEKACAQFHTAQLGVRSNSNCSAWRALNFKLLSMACAQLQAAQLGVR